jgi:maleylpyruvate isomerase
MTRSTTTEAPPTRAAAALALVDQATGPLLAAVGALDQRALAGPSLLPGWSRGHVVTHLARNADALVNLLTSARTGVERAAYPSRADRDADIAEGADRLAAVQREDLIAAGERFLHEAGRLEDEHWAVPLAHPSGRPMIAAEIPELRLFEMWVHLVDLDAGIGFGDVGHLEVLIDVALRNRPGVRVVAELADGRQVVSGTGRAEVGGPAAEVLAWLAGRGPASALSGVPPELGAWG